MAKGQSKAADNQLNLSNQYASQGNGRANDIFNSLFPTLQNQYANPTASNPELASAGNQFQEEINNPMGLSNVNGYSATDKNAMTTASNQSLGGAVGGAVGQGNLMAARTGNAGGYATALDNAVRDAGKTQSQNALGVQEDSAKLSAQQQQASDELKSANKNAGLQGLEQNAMGISGIQQNALQGIQNLYGDSMQELMSALGLGPGTLNARAAGQSGFQQFMSGLGTLGGGVGSAVTGMNNAGFFG